MVGIGIRSRKTGASAYLCGQDKPVIRSMTGGELTLENSVTGEGFNAIDLLYASLSACLVMSARISARKLGFFDRIKSYQVQVSGEKTSSEPYRITHFAVEFMFESDLTENEQYKLAEMSETICTVSNTLRAGADVHFEVVTINKPAV